MGRRKPHPNQINQFEEIDKLLKEMEPQKMNMKEIEEANKQLDKVEKYLNEYEHPHEEITSADLQNPEYDLHYWDK